jgi:hypothetical protein
MHARGAVKPDHCPSRQRPKGFLGPFRQRSELYIPVWDFILDGFLFTRSTTLYLFRCSTNPCGCVLFRSPYKNEHVHCSLNHRQLFTESRQLFTESR